MIRILNKNSSVIDKSKKRTGITKHNKLDVMVKTTTSITKMKRLGKKDYKIPLKIRDISEIFELIAKEIKTSRISSIKVVSDNIETIYDRTNITNVSISEYDNIYLNTKNKKILKELKLLNKEEFNIYFNNQTTRPGYRPRKVIDILDSLKQYKSNIGDSELYEYELSYHSIERFIQRIVPILIKTDSKEKSIVTLQNSGILELLANNSYKLNNNIINLISLELLILANQNKKVMNGRTINGSTIETDFIVFQLLDNTISTLWVNNKFI